MYLIHHCMQPHREPTKNKTTLQLQYLNTKQKETEETPTVCRDRLPYNL